MRIFVKQAKHFPEFAGLNPLYPIQCREIHNDIELPEFNEVSMSLEEFNTLKISLKTDYEAFKQAVLVPREELADYKNFRSDAYPTVGDQLDQIYKGVKELALKSPALDTWVATIDAVKARYPKP